MEVSNPLQKRIPQVDQSPARSLLASEPGRRRRKGPLRGRSSCSTQELHTRVTWRLKMGKDFRQVVGQ